MNKFTDLNNSVNLYYFISDTWQSFRKNYHWRKGQEKSTMKFRLSRIFFINDSTKAMSCMRIDSWALRISPNKTSNYSLHALNVRKNN